MPKDIEKTVYEHYAGRAREPVPFSCCTARPDPSLTAFIPEEVLRRDFGCGDPSRFLREGDAVLDLGSGAGKLCFVASKLVGPAGRVIGVDSNDEMLAVAERNRAEVARRLGHANVEFRKGRIQDLALDLRTAETWFGSNPVRTVQDLAAFEEWAARERAERPMVAPGAIDIVVSNCVLNLVRDEDKAQLFREMHRVLRTGGRIAISDIVADEEVPEHLKADPDLWSACVTGAFTEEGFQKALEDAGFTAIAIETWTEAPYSTVEGIEFRSVTFTARKGEEGPCLDRGHAVIYRGPWRAVEDDYGNRYPRGRRVALCDPAYRRITNGPTAGDVVALPPRTEVPAEGAPPFRCGEGVIVRHPRETKGERPPAPAPAPGTGTCCCTPSEGS